MLEPACLRFVFVGAFDEDMEGGQAYACRTLIGSSLSRHVDWIKIANGVPGNPAPSRLERLRAARRRSTLFLRAIRAPDVDGALIFSSAGFSFVEKGLMVLTAKLNGKRAIFCPRSGLLLDHMDGSLAMRLFVRTVLSAADAVVCQSESWAQVFRSISPGEPEKFRVIPNWIDVKEYVSAESTDAPAQVTFLYLGRIEPYKGIFDLVDAAFRFRVDLGHVRILVCGAGTSETAARARVKELGLDWMFEFRGWIDHDAKLHALRSAHIVVIPSHREGMPNTMLEAMASGLPVIATNVGAIPEVIPAATFGTVVEHRDPLALGAAMVAFAADQDARRTIGKAARQRVTDEYDVERAWPKILKLLQGR